MSNTKDILNNSNRKWPRQTISPHDLPATMIHGEREIAGQVKDLSPMGIGILIGHQDPPLHPGLRVMVDLSTNLDSAPLRLTAKVVQVTPPPRQGPASPTLVGLSFIEMNDELERQLEAFLIVVEEAEQELHDDRGTRE